MAVTQRFYPKNLSTFIAGCGDIGSFDPAPIPMSIALFKQSASFNKSHQTLDELNPNTTGITWSLIMPVELTIEKDYDNDSISFIIPEIIWNFSSIPEFTPEEFHHAIMWFSEGGLFAHFDLGGPQNPTNGIRLTPNSSCLPKVLLSYSNDCEE